MIQIDILDVKIENVYSSFGGKGNVMKLDKQITNEELLELTKKAFENNEELDKFMKEYTGKFDKGKERKRTKQVVSLAEFLCGEKGICLSYKSLCSSKCTNGF